MYQVGHLIHYQENDPLFDAIDKARAYIKKEFTEYCEFPIGIWQMEDPYSLLIEIFMQGEYFVKEPID